MTLRTILHYPNPRLKLPSQPVEKIDLPIHQLIGDMLETMYEDNGIGLAAPQIDIQKRIVTIDISPNRSAPLVLINPVILETRGEQVGPEGCLSIPNIFEKIKRPAYIKVQALDINGKKIEIEGEKLLAACLQHEIDHLNGILFIEHLSKLKHRRIIKKIEKLRKKNL